MVRMFVFTKYWLFTALIVAETPSNVTITNSSSDTLLVSWNPPATLVPVSGYEVFYLTAAGEAYSAGNTTDTNLTLNRFEKETCLYLVAFKIYDEDSNSGQETVHMCFPVLEAV